MPNAQYNGGRKLEYEAMADLTGNGYILIRAAGSHGPADLVAVKPGETLVIQCKRDGYVTPPERAKLILLAIWMGATPLVAWWRKDGRAARRVAYCRYTYSNDPPEPWTPDHALETS